MFDPSPASIAISNYPRRFFTPAENVAHGLAQRNVFLHGLMEGYNTMDLLAAFFFSSMVVFSLKRTFVEEGNLIKIASGQARLGQGF